jgi:hypothetical protein
VHRNDDEFCASDFYCRTLWEGAWGWFDMPLISLAK